MILKPLKRCLTTLTTVRFPFSLPESMQLIALVCSVKMNVTTSILYVKYAIASPIDCTDSHSMNRKSRIGACHWPFPTALFPLCLTSRRTTGLDFCLVCHYLRLDCR